MRALPPAFTDEMRALFERFERMAEWPDFLASFEVKPVGGLRANRLKISAQELRDLLEAEIEPAALPLKAVSWSDDGFYLPPDFQPGKLPWHSVGLFYIQEPSAMLPAAVLGAKPGERILDLCAAPGGKTCRIAADLAGKGLLWANEISADRARALLHNVELTGCSNCIITTETPERLAERLPQFFDRILVDAPCSGSGMFRRDPSAMDSWLDYGSEHCTNLQRGILLAAWTMLRPGGTLVYSTCTFSIAENEEMILWLTGEMPDCLIEPITKAAGVSNGLPLTPGMTGTVRIWPHLADGDGHFCALLHKAAADLPDEQLRQPAAPETLESTAAWGAFDRFCTANLSDSGQKRLKQMIEQGSRRFERDCLHLLPPDFQVPDHLRKVKTGLFLGQVKVLRDKNVIYEPSQAFLFSLTAQDLRLTIQGPPDSDLIRRYLRGETVSANSDGLEKSGSFAAILMSGPIGSWPLGWVKTMGGGMLKNLYPPAWRRQI